MAAKPQVTAKPAAPQVLQFDFKATVQADGSVTNIEPDAALPEPIKAMIRKRVATWRYKPAQWQGKTAASIPIEQTIKAVAVPTTQGGVALRIEEVTGKTLSGEASKKRFAMQPLPPFPPDLQKRGASAQLVYAILYDEAGKPQQVDLMYPAELDRNIRGFDEASRKTIAKWVAPKTFDGMPISCRERRPIGFNTGDESLPLRVPPEVASSFDKYTDMCPLTTLETPAAGTFL